MKPFINNSLKLGEVGLRVKNLEVSIDFYTRIIGLTLLEKKEERAWVGIDNHVFIELIADETFVYPEVAYTGLYHIALLVPHEKDLGQLLYHFARLNYQIDGAGDHLYSQALYMHDPDGHGIEIYADRPKSEWTIHSDGTIESDTRSVNFQHLIDLVEVESWNGLPQGTTIGHIHLQVKNIKEFENFYVEMLGFDIKTRWNNTALFVSKNGYHHHIGANTWAKPQAILPKKTIGLDYITLYINNIEDIKNEFCEQSNIEIHDNAISIYDSNGIHLIIRSLQK